MYYSEQVHCHVYLSISFRIISYRMSSTCTTINNSNIHIHLIIALCGIQARQGSTCTTLPKC